jgi:hypothetical protein
MAPADRCEVYLIHGQAESSQECIFRAVMPDAPGPVGQSLERARQKAIADWQEYRKTSVFTVKNATQANSTDLFGFCRFAGHKQGFKSHDHPYLILFTDAQQVGDGMNLEKKAPDDTDIETIRKKGLLPDLKDIRVVMAGVTPTHGITNAHWRTLQTFWENFLKATGASSIEFSSERNITES